MRRDAEYFLRDKSREEDAVLDKLQIVGFDLDLGMPEDVIKTLANQPSAVPTGRIKHTSGHGSFLRSKIEYDGSSSPHTLTVPRKPKR